MSKNQIRWTYIVTFLLLVPPKLTQFTGHVHWSPINKEVIITKLQSNWVAQKDGLVLKITLH